MQITREFNFHGKLGIAITGRNERIRLSICARTSAVSASYSRMIIYRKLLPAKACRLLVKHDLRLKKRIRSRICAKTRAQVTRELQFSSQFGSAKVCRSLANHDFGLKISFSDANLCPKQGAGYS